MFVVKQEYTDTELEEAFGKFEEQWEIDMFKREEDKNRQYVKSKQIVNKNANDNVYVTKKDMAV